MPILPETWSVAVCEVMGIPKDGIQASTEQTRQTPRESRPFALETTTSPPRSSDDAAACINTSSPPSHLPSSLSINNYTDGSAPLPFLPCLTLLSFRNLIASLPPSTPTSCPPYPPTRRTHRTERSNGGWTPTVARSCQSPFRPPV
jgi:hypothetical protein